MVVTDDDGASMGAHGFAEHMAYIERRAVCRAALQKHAGKQAARAVEREHVKVFKHAAEEQGFEILAGLEKRIQARRTAERLNLHKARNAWNQACLLYTS